MNIFIEKLSSTDGNKIEVGFDKVSSALNTASSIAKSGSFEEELVVMGDVIHVKDKLFLVEADQTVTEIDQDEYAYYKRIETKNRISQWFEGSIN